MNIRHTVTALLLAAVLVPGLVAGEPQALARGKSIERELSAGESHDYSIKLKQGWFLLAVVDQRGIDVIVRVIDPAGAEIGSFDSPNGANGPEPVSLFAEQAGKYRIEVTPFDDASGSGRYAIELLRREPGAASPGGKVDQLFARWDAPGSPGAAVAVARDAETVFEGGYGRANLEYDVPITPQTVFHVASVSKQFTAFAVTLLAEQGKLTLDDDVRSHLPEVPDFGATITLRHLIHHTSGLRDQWNLLALAGWRLDDVITTEQILKTVSRQQDLNFQPGEEHLYCNTGYTLLALVVERVTGQFFRDWTQQNMFEPLGMDHTHFHDDHEMIVPNRAYSYSPMGEGYRKAVLSYANAGATSLFTTVGDLLKWNHNLDTGKLGGPEVIAMMHQTGELNDNTRLDYASGLFVGEFRGLRSVSHSGGDAGFRSHLVRFPDQRLSVAVLANLGTFNPSALALQVAEIYLGDALEPPPAPPAAGEGEAETAEAIPVDPAFLQACSGSYQLPDGPVVRVDYRDGQLIGAVPGQPPVQLVPRGPNEFRVEQIGATVVFERDEAGEVTGLTLDQQGQQIRAGRVPPFDPGSVVLADYTGEYYSRELQTSYTVIVEDGRLIARHPRHSDVRLAAQGPDLFSGDQWFFSVAGFVRGADGEIAEVLVSSGRVRGVRFERRD